jgi:endonuclease/exonuclease/phosphatase family metal-dependent hydrolase
MLVNCITWNILATGFTNFNKGVVDKNDGETFDDMSLRYANVIRILAVIINANDMDFICLQEVDPLFYELLKELDFFSENFGLIYHKNVLLNSYKFKAFNLIMYRKNKWNLHRKFFLKITDQHHITQNKTRSNMPKRAQIAITAHFKNNDGEDINIVNTKLSGVEDRLDIRLDELRNIMDKIASKGKTMIMGDFNETDFESIDTTMHEYNYKIVKDYFMLDNFATSFHPFNIDWKKKEMYREKDEKFFECIDYMIVPSDSKILRQQFLPSADKGIFEIEAPYNGDEPYNPNNWSSDHALLFFSIEL